MRRLQLMMVALSVGCLLAAGGVASAADDVLAVVPDSVLGVVVVNRIDQTNQRVAAVAQRLGQPMPNVLQLAKQRFGLEKGIDAAGSIAIAAVMGQGIAPVLFVPTGDFQALIKPFEPTDAGDGLSRIQVKSKTLVAAEKGGFAVVGYEKDAAAVKAVLASDQTLASAIESVSSWAAEKQAYAVATPAGIRFAKTQLLAGLEKIKEGIAQSGNEQAEATLAGLKMYELIFQAMDKELAYCVTALEIEEDGGIHIASRSLLADGGVLAGLSQKARPGKSSHTAGTMFPAGQFMAAGGGPMPRGMVKSMMGLSIEMMKMYPGGKDMSDAHAQEIVRLSVKSMKRMRGMAMIIGIPAEGQPLYSRMLIAWKVQGATEYLAEYKEMITRMAKIGSEAGIPFMNYEVEDIEVAGAKGLKLTMDMGAMFGEQQIPQAEQMMELMFGKDGKMTVYIAVADEQTVLGSYVSLDVLKESLKLHREGGESFANDPLVAKTTAMFPAGVQWVGYWSPEGTVEFVRRAIGAMAPQVPAVIPQFGPSAPIGFALKLEPGMIETDLVIPADVIDASAIFVGQVIASQAAQAGAAAPQ